MAYGKITNNSLKWLVVKQFKIIKNNLWYNDLNKPIVT
jgi:hypothetical protein